MEALQALGLTPAAEALLVRLMQRPETSPTDQDPVEELIGLGLVERTDDALVVRPPRLAMDALAERHTKQAALARESADLLTESWRPPAARTTSRSSRRTPPRRPC
ncbi:hypothetical protein [Kribbella rubisoli]|nr:hypothetical protein [Kribbella rubisoli]